MRVRATHPLVSSLALLALAAACSGGDKTPGAGGSAAAGPDSSRAGATTATACAGGTAELTLPAGFCATVFADSIVHGRFVTVASNGDVYITLEGTQPSPEKQISGVAKQEQRASFVALRDTNHDGHADIVKRIPGLGNTGVGLHNGYLYVDEGTRIVRYARADTALVPAGKAEVVVDGIPLSPGHRARNFAFNGDSGLFVNVGSATNSCQQKDRGLESKGVDPCTELRTRAGTWLFNANATNQHFSPSARFATGIRNGMGMDFGSDGKLYQTQHGRDQLHDSWPKVFPTTVYQAENPAEELIQVNQNDDFGW
ncbi:MAG: L-sorbosone dehydrogenase, partial [Gemmatimonadetes bacterium]|nr:L-sorbosone dehydrogenase [Gemmatimonadota bacterium]